MEQCPGVQANRVAGELPDVKPQEWSNNHKRWIAQRIGPDREMRDNVTGMHEVENAERKRSEENREEHIRSAFPDAFIIKQQDNKDPQYDSAVGKRDYNPL